MYIGKLESGVLMLSEEKPKEIPFIQVPDDFSFESDYVYELDLENQSYTMRKRVSLIDNSENVFQNCISDTVSKI